MPEPLPIARAVFSTQQLIADFPPKLRDRNKKVVHRRACPPIGLHHGNLEVTRWAAMPLPEIYAGTGTMIESREDVFSYEPPAAGSVEWHLNFAHADLFCAYGGPAFAQDEIQVAEHPALASLREALLASDGLAPVTVENGRPTPVLIRGVERRCVVATDSNDFEGRPFGLYGGQFTRAQADVVERAVRLLEPPTVTNLIAMEAPSYGSGAYQLDEIAFIVQSAYTGFLAAQIESANQEVVIHTGFWGCGAYGGNRVLMALLQMLAARLAATTRLVVHTFDAAGTEAFGIARRMLEHDLPQEAPLAEVLAKVQAVGFRWGTSDGN